MNPDYKNMYKNVKYKKIVLTFLFLILSAFNAFVTAQTFYWENPVTIVSKESLFPTVVNTDSGSYLFWEEVDSKKKELWLSCRYYSDIQTYSENLRFAGPFSYYDEVPDLYSATCLKNGSIVIPVLESAGKIAVYVSDNKASSFKKSEIKTDSSSVAPRIYANSSGGVRLFLSTVVDEQFCLFYMDSSDGIHWSSQHSFAPGAVNPFIPCQIAVDGGELVVYQALTSASQARYQLYSTFSSDGGKTWTEPILLTDQKSLPDTEEKSYLKFTNQRPQLYEYKNKIYLAWQRTSGINSSIWISETGVDGLKTRTISDLSENNTQSGNASRPLFFEYEDKLYVEWFDTRSGRESVYIAKQNGFDWDELEIVKNQNKNMFPYPVILQHGGKEILSFVWQQTNASGKNTLGSIVQDTSVKAPTLSAVSYKEGRRSTKKDVQIQINFPKDSSGIAGYSYTWGKENTREPPPVIQSSSKNKTVTLSADDEGSYVLKVRVTDNAGNWSDSASISYYRDITPPEVPSFGDFSTDSYGFLDSNTFKLNWLPVSDSDVAGYNYRLDYLGSIPSKLVQNKTHKITMKEEQVLQEIEKIHKKYERALSNTRPLPSNVASITPSTVRFYNRKNGVYVLYVSAIDGVGNVSEAASKIVILNKYMPQTYITSAGHETNSIGEVELVINGGGFTYEGTISEIYIDRDGIEPYDLSLKLSEGQYQVVSDSKISKVKIGTNLDEGLYKVLLLHTDRGLYKSGNVLEIMQTGTVKIQSDYKYVPQYKYIGVQKDRNFTITLAVILVLSVILVAGAIILAIVLVKIAKEKRTVREEINSLITGGYMPHLKQKVTESNTKRGSLRTKLVGFTVILLILVVIGMTMQSGFKMVNTQRETLADGLQNRVDVFMESLSSGARNFIPAIQDTELSLLLEQQTAVPEAQYVTVLGVLRESGTYPDEDRLNRASDVVYVWASKDPEIEQKIDRGQNYSAAKKGTIAIKDNTMLDIVKKFQDLNLNHIATERISSYSEDLKRKSAEYTSIALAMDEDSVALKNSLSDETKVLRNNIDKELRLLSIEYSYSMPGFDTQKLDTQNTEYLFYRPVFQYSSSSDNYLIGIIIIKVSTEELLNEINIQRRNVVITGLISAFVAIFLGVLGSMLLASLIVRPIKKLENHLEEVGNLMTKSVRERQRLEKKYIEIKSKDEIGRLGDVVNKMTLSAGAAAYEEFLQQDGKLVQERFIPLADGEGGRKLPIVRFNDDKVSLYAFYKGDSAVSGDYFDYKKLDDEWYVFIKCDISGHGVPAALLVSVVATKFKDFYYFSNWSYKKQGLNLKKFVSTVNDFIFDLGTRGKFSTINISLYNKNTGELYVCNAGDNKLHIYENATRKVKEITLANTPTAGGVSTDLVEMTAGGYKIEKFKLNPGDILYLYTDGIDEAERLVRNPDFTVKQVLRKEKKFNPETKQEEDVETVDDEKEQFGTERVVQIIEAVLNKGKFVLEKKDNPLSYECLEFDFTTCKGTIDESILALAAAERVFRLVKYPGIKEDDEIEMEKLLDSFLKEHFNLYSLYCTPAKAVEETPKRNSGKGRATKNDESKQRQLEDPNVVRYGQISEDKQADDITLIAIKRT